MVFCGANKAETFIQVRTRFSDAENPAGRVLVQAVKRARGNNDLHADAMMLRLLDYLECQGPLDEQ